MGVLSPGRDGSDWLELRTTTARIGDGEETFLMIRHQWHVFSGSGDRGMRDFLHVALTFMTLLPQVVLACFR